MRLLEKGEIVHVSGEDLIGGVSDCGSAVVASVVGRYDSLEGTTFGITLAPAKVHCLAFKYSLSPGMYFSFCGPGRIYSDCAVAITRIGYTGFNLIGGPIEAEGRLRYIDGCSDSLLIGPPVLGDPCFNLLHFPKNVRQTMHTHPSLRCGITVSGRGRAIFPDGEVPLEPGRCWFLKTGGQHCFYTDDEEMIVTAWHPDTDTGPSHDNHPMLNKTMVGGVSAKNIQGIRTKG